MADAIDGENELVVLVHGFGVGRGVMWPLACRLRANGFRVLYWNYLSLFATIESHAERLYDFLATRLSSETRIHMVAHSMGSIVVRAALNRYPLPNIGRLVLLAPPNGGSPVARLVSVLIGGVLVPTRELSDQASSYVRQLRGPNGIDIGIIAGRYDMLVPLPNTHLAGARAHETLFATHNSLLLSRTVCSMSTRFIRTGTFVMPHNSALNAEQVVDLVKDPQEQRSGSC